MDYGNPRWPRQGRVSSALLLLLLTTGLCGPAAWAAGPTARFSIPEGDAESTLRDFTLQSQLQILYITEKVRGVRTNAVSGDLDVSAAIAMMLKGTVLEYEFQSDYSFVAVRPQESVGSAEPLEMGRAASAAINASEHARRNPLDALAHAFSEKDLEEVVVTGTLIRGVLDIMSPLVFVTGKEMKKTGYATVQDALQALPVNFGGGPSEDFSPGGNFSRGVSVNLRGLGAGATLVLVDGRRQPYSGVEGDFVDISNIPWSAVERIEVLPDGASALYGSDAIAGVVNIIMRKDLRGAETQVRYGSGKGGAGERVFSQLFGSGWETGNALLSYQYSERTALSAADRAYAANEDKRSFGGRDHRSYLSNPGNVVDPRSLTPLFGVPAGQDGRSLDEADLLPGEINLLNRYATVELLPDRRMHNVFLSASQELGERFELFGDGRFSRRDISQTYFASDQLLMVPASNPFFVNPFPGAPFGVVAYSFVDDLGPLAISADVQSYSAALGVKADLTDTWRLTVSGTHGRERMSYVGDNQPNAEMLAAALADPDPETAFNPYGDGAGTNPATLAAIRTARLEHARSGIAAVSFIADGTVAEISQGAVRLAVGGESRREELERGTNVTPAMLFDRSVQSAFAELSVPLIGVAGDPLAAPRLELSLAGRYERYSDFGSTSNPKVGLRWAPNDSLKLRASWGTSFKAPKLVDIYDSSRNLAGLAVLEDPVSELGSSVVLVNQGNNPNLKEETATTWTAGIDLAPRQVPGLGVSLTLYSIEYKDRIVLPGPNSPFDILLHEDRWQEIISRAPRQSEIESLCDSAAYSGSVSQCKSAPIAAIVDFRVRNLASTRVRGLDLKLDHSLDTRYGNFGFGLSGSYVLSFEEAVSDTSPMDDVVNTVGNPLALRLRGSAEWYQRSWDMPGFGVSMAVDHFGAYDDPDTLSGLRVDSLTTLDLRLSYRTQRGDGLLDDLELALNAMNVFDAAPPFVDRDAGYDMINAEPFGRVVSFGIQKRW